VRKHCHSVSVAQNSSLCTSKFEKLPFFPSFCGSSQPGASRC